MREFRSEVRSGSEVKRVEVERRRGRALHRSSGGRLVLEALVTRLNRIEVVMRAIFSLSAERRTLVRISITSYLLRRMC